MFLLLLIFCFSIHFIVAVLTVRNSHSIGTTTIITKSTLPTKATTKATTTMSTSKLTTIINTIYIIITVTSAHFADTVTREGKLCLGGTYVGNHRQVPGGRDPRLRRTRVLGPDEGDGLVEVLLRHASDRRQRVRLVVDKHIVESVSGQHPLIRVDMFERVDQGADKVLILSLVSAERRQKAEREVLGIGHAEDSGQNQRCSGQSRQGVSPPHG